MDVTEASNKVFWCVLCQNVIYIVFLNFRVTVFFLNIVKLFHNSGSGSSQSSTLIEYPNGVTPLPLSLSLSICLPEFSVLVDVLNVERGCVNPVSDDDILSLYQFNISSANTQPTDKGKRMDTCSIATVFTLFFTPIQTHYLLHFPFVLLL